MPQKLPSGFVLEKPYSSSLPEGFVLEDRKGRGALGWGQDIGLSLLSGTTWVPQAIVGISDIVTAPNRWALEKITGKDLPTNTKMLQNIGLDFTKAQEVASGLKTDQSQESRENVNRAFEEGGIYEGIGGIWDNPSVALESIAESIPSMVSMAATTSMVALRIFSTAAKTVPAGGEAAILAGKKAVELAMPKLRALSVALEGGLVGGQSASQFAEDGDLTGREIAASVGTGITTAGVGVLSNKIGGKLGLEDVEAAIGTRGLRNSPKSGLIGSAMRGGLKEGLLEEGPQSSTEQMWQNWANRENITEGVGQAGAEGLVVGTLMGFFGGGASGFRTKSQKSEDAINRITDPNKSIDDALAEANDILDESLVEFTTGNVPSAQDAVDTTYDPSEEIFNLETNISSYEEQLQAGLDQDNPQVQNQAQEALDSARRQLAALSGVDFGNQSELTTSRLGDQPAALVPGGEIPGIDFANDALGLTLETADQVANRTLNYDGGVDFTTGNLPADAGLSTEPVSRLGEFTDNGIDFEDGTVDRLAAGVEREVQTFESKFTPEEQEPTFDEEVSKIKASGNTLELKDAIAALGGISVADAKAEGAMDLNQKQGFKWLGTKNGMSFDAMREALAQDGFDFATANDLVDALTESINDRQSYYAPAGYELQDLYEFKRQEEDQKQLFDDGELALVEMEDVYEPESTQQERVMADRVVKAIESGSFSEDPNELEEYLATTDSDWAATWGVIEYETQNAQGNFEGQALQSGNGQEERGPNTGEAQGASQEEIDAFENAFELDQPTEQSLQDDAATVAATQAEALTAAQRADADAQVDDFVLAGSDSTVDQAEARGQSNMFDQEPALSERDRAQARIEASRAARLKPVIDVATGEQITPTGNRSGDTATYTFADGTVQSRANDEVSAIDDAQPVEGIEGQELNTDSVIAVADYYQTPGARDLAKKVKSGDAAAITQMATEMAAELELSPGSIFVPIPSSGGVATYTKQLANEIAAINGGTVSDILKGSERESLYDTKKSGGNAAEVDFGFRLDGDAPQGNIVLVDNVMDTGETASAAFRLLPGSSVLVHSASNGQPSPDERTLEQVKQEMADNEAAEVTVESMEAGSVLSDEAAAIQLETIRTKLIAEEIPVIQDGSLYYTVSPSTRVAGSYQITTYNDSGALGDTTVETIDQIGSLANGIDLARVDILSEADAEQVMARVVSGESEFQSNKSNEGQAKTGGEYGLNGQWYKGGQFMPASARTVKGEWKFEVSKTGGAGKSLIAPGEFARSPEGHGSLYQGWLQEFTRPNENGDLERFEGHSDDTLMRNSGWTPAQLQERIDLFNNGVRFTAIGSDLTPYSPDATAPESQGSTEPKSELAQATEAMQQVAAALTAQNESPAETSLIASIDENLAKMPEGELSIAEFKAAFEFVVENEEGIKAELSKLTKAQLLDRMDGYSAERNKNDKKASVVRSAFDDMVSDFMAPTAGESGMISFTIGVGGDAMASKKAKIDQVTQEDLDGYAKKVSTARENRARQQVEREEGIENPETIDDYRNIMNALARDAGVKTFKEARALMPFDQRVEYDRLLASESREKRNFDINAQKTRLLTSGQLVEGEIIETTHTKNGNDLFVVQLADRVPREDFLSLNSSAKKLGGRYSSFRGNGAVPGFTFTSRESAEAFKSLAGGDSQQAEGVAQARRDAFVDDRSQSAVERLRDMAEKLDSRGNESLSQDRKENTARRAGMAANAEAKAQSSIALSKTMSRIADGIEAGEITFLDQVRAKTQVDMLESFIGVAKSDQAYSDKDLSYSQKEEIRNAPATAEAVEFATFPEYTAYRSDLAKLGRQLQEISGTKRLGDKLMKISDDVTTQYTTFAKNNLSEVSNFVKKDGSTASFSTKKAAQASIYSSGFDGKAVAIEIKRGEHVIVMSPSEAQKSGVWDGQEDTKVSLSKDFATELVEKVGRKSVSLPWQLDSAHEKRKRLSAMNIETPAEFRSALQEYVGLQEIATAPDKIKELERKMVGRSNDDLDFFPTPAGIAEEMIETAGIEEGMTVLEPSAGMGHIADQMRQFDIEPDVIEMSGARRELLEAKGYNLVGNDFLESTGQYDRIIMNPPFSDRRDFEHVKHAYSLLKPGGRLVAIVGEGVFFGSDKRAQEFRTWFESVEGTDEKLAEGTFQDPSLPVTTGASARMIVVEKDSVQSAPLESRLQATGNGMTAAAVSEAIGPMLETFSDEVAQEAIVVQSFSDLPASITDYYDLDNPPTSRALYYEGTAYFIADAISTVREARTAVAHELIGHKGILEYVNEQEWSDIKSTIDQQLGNNAEQATSIMAEVDRRYPGASKETKYKEFLAVAAERRNLRGTLKDLIEKVKAMLRGYLKSMGLRGPFSESDIEIILQNSEKNLRGSQDLSASGSDTANSMGNDAGMVPAASSEISFDKISPEFFSQLYENVSSITQSKSSPEQLLAAIRKKGGVKEEEIQWTGIDKFLAGKKSVTKQEVLDYLADNMVQVDMVEIADDESDYASIKEQIIREYAEEEGLYFDNGGEGYSYLLEQDSEGNPLDADESTVDPIEGSYDDIISEIGTLDYEENPDSLTEYKKYTLPGGANYREILFKLPDGPDQDADYKSPHYTRERARNLLASVRANDRVGPNGEKILFIEEIQSDWHQSGKKEGYGEKATYEIIEPTESQMEKGDYNYSALIRSPNGSVVNSKLGFNLPDLESWASKQVSSGEGGIPDAPFKGNAWVELSVKKILRIASEGGYDQVAWTNGQQQADRYSLSKQVEVIRYNAEKQNLQVWKKDPDSTDQYMEAEIDESVTPEDIEKYIGKEAAQKILSDDNQKDNDGYSVLKGDSLNIGGEGMKSFYDKTVPNIFSKVVKKLDKSAKIGQTTVVDDQAQQALTITPAMKDAVMQGMPLFSAKSSDGQAPMQASAFGSIKEGDNWVDEYGDSADINNIEDQVNEQIDAVIGMIDNDNPAAAKFASEALPSLIYAKENNVPVSDISIKKIQNAALRYEEGSTPIAQEENQNSTQIAFLELETEFLQSSINEMEQRPSKSIEVRRLIKKDQALLDSYSSELSVLKSGAGPDILASDGTPDSEFAAENRAIREEDKTAWSKAKTELKRQLTAGGLLPDSVFNSKIARDNELAVVEFDAAHYIGELERAVRDEYGVNAGDLTETDQFALSEGLSGSMPKSVKPKTKESLIKMRVHIDNISQEYIAILQEQTQQLSANLDEGEQILLSGFLEAGNIEVVGTTPAAKGQATRQRNEIMSVARETAKETWGSGKQMQASLGKVATIAEKISLMGTIIANDGKYVHRSYKAFDDPKWAKKVPDKVLNNAREYLVEQIMTFDDLSQADAQTRARVVIEDILKEGTAYDNMESFINESKLGAKDLSVLKRRKQIAPEIRELLGEYRDPRVNYAKTVTKMGRLVFNQRFLEQVREAGMGVFLFNEDDRPPNTTQIAADGSESYSPLNGLYTTRETNQAFKDALGKEQMADWYRYVIQVNGAVKFGKTVLSPTTAARNWQSAMFFTLANGHFDLTHMSKSVSGFKEYFTQAGDKEKLDYLRKLKLLGVVYDTPYAGEMMRLLQDSNVENLIGGTPAGMGVKNALGVAQKFYQYGDDFWKIIGFENEKQLLIESGTSEADAEIEAAERIRNTYPTYSMTGRAVNWLRRFPLAGTFVSFPSEIVRTSYHIMRYAATDMANPARRSMGIRRLSGMAVASGLAYAAQAISKSMFDIDDEEEEAVRLQAAPWQKNSNLVFTGRDENQNLQYFDISFLDPYNYFKRPINAILRDQPWEKEFASAASDMVSPFFGTDIMAGALSEVWMNKKSSGGKIYNESDSPVNQTKAMMNHIRKSAQPGIVSNLERTYKALNGEVSASGKKYDIGDEAWSWVGWRMSTLDPKTALLYRSYEFGDVKRDATQVLTRVLKDRNDIDEGDVEEAYELSLKIRKQGYDDMITLVKASMKSGLTAGDVRAVLRNSGVSLSDVNALVTGRVPPWVPSTQQQTSAYRSARAVLGPEKAAEIRRRYSQARKLRRPMDD